MVTNLSKQNGSALLFGLVALFAASLTGMSLMQLSRGDKMSSVEFTKMRSAAVAARAALHACERQFATRPQLSTDILNEFVSDPSHQWLLVTDVAAAVNEYRMSVNSSMSNSPKMSARIMEFDPVNYLLQVEITGYGGSSSRDRAIGYYALKGLGPEKNYGNEYAIYMGGEGRNFDKEVTINGNVYFGADVHFNSSASGSVINGSFRTGSSTNQSSFDGQVTINGAAHFQTPVKSQNGSINIDGKSGFEKEVWLDANLQLYENAYFNGDVTGNRWVDMNTYTATHSGILTPSKVINYDAISNRGETIDIASELGLSTGNDGPFSVDLSAITPSKIKTASSLGFVNVTGGQVQGAYDAALSAGELWNGYLVVRVDGNMNMNPSGTIVDADVIWIVGNGNSITCNGNWYEAAANTSTMLYVDGGTVNQLGSDGYFRGYVHVTGTGNVSYQWGLNNDVVGALHHVSPDCEFQLNQGSRLNLTYDHSVITEFVDLDLVSAPAPAPGTIVRLVLTDTKIRPFLIGVHY